MTIFKWKNEFLKQLGLEKQMEKMGSFVWFSCLLPELWSLNCQKLCPFCIFFANVSNKSRVVIVVYVYTPESSYFELLENGIGYYAMIYSLEDIRVWRWWISLNSCWFSTFFEILFLSISWTVGQTTIKHTIFWKSMIRSSRWI